MIGAVFEIDFRILVLIAPHPLPLGADDLDHQVLPAELNRFLILVFMHRNIYTVTISPVRSIRHQANTYRFNVKPCT